MIVTTTAPRDTVRAALDRLIDYAGLFPPAELSMSDALSQYERAREGGASWMLSRFIVPATRLHELQQSLEKTRARLELSVIAAPDAFELLQRIRSEDWATIASVEVPLGNASVGECAERARDAGFLDLPIFVELPRAQRAMAELAAHGLAAKLRCGGVEPSAYPGTGDVAAFIDEAVAAGVPFKATAGLHHPVRHFNEGAGVTMHGFLNLLVAAERAGSVDRGELEAIVAQEDPAQLTLADETALRRARERFVSYGSCSFEEPVEDLRALHLLSAS